MLHFACVIAVMLRLVYNSACVPVQVMHFALQHYIMVLLQAWECGVASDTDPEWRQRATQLRTYHRQHGDTSVGHRDGDDPDLARYKLDNCLFDCASAPSQCAHMAAQRHTLALSGCLHSKTITVRLHTALFANQLAARMLAMHMLLILGG